MKKKIIHIDMDGVLVDLGREIEYRLKDPNLDPKFIKEPDLIEGLFESPQPIEGAIDAVKELQDSDKFDLFIATSAPWENPPSLMHKRLWIEHYFGTTFHKRMFITHRKDLLVGDYLIDDRLANGAETFTGELIHFGKDYKTFEPNPFPTWDSVLNYLLK